MIQRAQAPWLSDEIKSVKRLQRIAERNWRSTKSESDRRTFKLLRNKAVFLMNKSHCEFYTDFINITGNQHKLFAATKKLLNQSAKSPFPLHSDKLALAKDMGSFFVKKISDLCASLDAAANSCNTISHHSSQFSSSFTVFHRVDMDYLRKLVLRTPTKSCLLDPVPTNIMKDCLDELLPILTTMINLSLESGFFPVIWKDSVVTPLLKKPGLDLVFKNFRPISNLSFVSKLAERVVADQIQPYLSENDLFPTLQSAYRQYHSTETALLKVKNDILMNMEDKHVTLLVFLDLSAAFDTVDHRILLDRLQFDFGISGSALNWFESYLSYRTQCISIDGVLSNTFNLKYGVP